MNQVQYGSPTRNANRAQGASGRAAQRRHADEDKAWSYLYRSIKDPAAAAEVVEHLQADDEMRRQHTALYLRSRETLRRERARVVRNQRWGQVVRAALAALVDLFAGVRRMARNGGDIALEIVAPVQGQQSGADKRVEPATARVRKLAKNKSFAGECSPKAAPASAATSTPEPITAGKVGADGSRDPGRAKAA